MWYTNRIASYTTNTKPIYVHRGMSSPEYYSWIDKGFVPKGKDVVSDQLAEWAYEHSTFGANDIMIGFLAPPGTVKAMQNPKGHFRTVADIPINEQSIDIEYGELKSREQLAQQQQEQQDSKSECLQYLQPGVKLFTKSSGAWSGVEILSKKGRSYTVKPIYREEISTRIVELQKSIKDLTRQIEFEQNFKQLYDMVGGDQEKLFQYGYRNGETPDESIIPRLVDEIMPLQDELEAEKQKVKEENANRIIAMSESDFPKSFQNGAIAQLPDGSEANVPFDLWFRDILSREKH